MRVIMAGIQYGWRTERDVGQHQTKIKLWAFNDASYTRNQMVKCGRFDEDLNATT